MATVFGEVKEWQKGGKYLVLFENKRSYHLKAKEFDVVANDSNQSIIGRNELNSMKLKSPQQGKMDNYKQPSIVTPTNKEMKNEGAKMNQDKNGVFYM